MFRAFVVVIFNFLTSINGVFKSEFERIINNGECYSNL